MPKEVTIFQANSNNPVLARFAIIKDGWLGLLEPRPRRRRRRTKKTGLLGKLSQLLEKKLRQLRRKVSAFFRRLFKRVAKIFLNGLIAGSVVAMLIWFGPKLFYTVFPPQAEPVQAEELSGDFQLNVDQEAINKKKSTPLELSKPPYNANLPEGDWLIIPRIGVRSLLQPTENYEDALTTGLWLAPDFGKPGDKQMPMIVAGHRFGFKWWWQDDYWKYHSFYLLPDLEPGDTVEVISDHRKYEYEIYAGEEGTEITDYQADLIIYTCKFLDSPVRIFRYAKLLPPVGETPLGGLR